MLGGNIIEIVQEFINRKNLKQSFLLYTIRNVPVIFS